MAKTEFTTQFGNFFKGLNFFQKFLFAGIIIALLSGLIFLIVSVSNRVEYSTLYRQLDPSEAGKIVEKLREKKIAYKLDDGGTTIFVDKNKVQDLRISLASEGIPETGFIGYELFDKTNLGMSEFIQKVNFRRALEGELARTISSLQGIKKARVHLVIPEKALFEKDQKEPTASVTIQLSNDKGLSKLNVRAIQNLVASSVEGLSPNYVVVIDSRGKILSEIEQEANSFLGRTQTQHEQQFRVEQYLTNKVQSLLDGALGPGNSEVRVSAELDFTQIEKTITDFNPERQVVRSEQVNTVSSLNVDSLQYPAPQRSAEQSSTIANYEIPQTIERIINNTGTIKRITVGALVNGTYQVVEKDGKRVVEYTPRNPEEIEKLEQIIKNAVGFDPNRNDQVSIVNVPFDTQQPDPEILRPERPWYEKPENIRLIILAVAIIFSLILMLILFRSRPIKEATRVAMALPEPHKLIEEEKDDLEHELEGLRTREDEMFLLPTEMPEQLLLTEEAGGVSIPTDDRFDVGLIKKPSVKLAEVPMLSEEAMMKMEIKDKIKEFIENQPQESAKLLRMYLSQGEQQTRELY